MAGFCRRRNTDCQPWWTERNPQSVELLVTLQQEAKSQNLFNEDEEDIERYIDDDDDDFVDHVRFQSQQVRKHMHGSPSLPIICWLSTSHDT